MGASDQLPLDTLLELLPGRFLLSKLSSSSDSEADKSEFCVDMDRLSLLLAFSLLERSDLCELWVFFFNFFFKFWTCRFKASTVSKFFSSVVQSVEDMLLFASILLGSRTFFDLLWCRDDCFSSLRSVRISDLTTTSAELFQKVTPRAIGCHC
jgi:hypothetical protein